MFSGVKVNEDAAIKQQSMKKDLNFQTVFTSELFFNSSKSDSKEC